MTTKIGMQGHPPGVGLTNHPPEPMTERMIQAGCQALAEFEEAHHIHVKGEWHDKVVKSVYRAMRRAIR